MSKLLIKITSIIGFLALFIGLIFLIMSHLSQTKWHEKAQRSQMKADIAELGQMVGASSRKEINDFLFRLYKERGFNYLRYVPAGQISAYENGRPDSGSTNYQFPISYHTASGTSVAGTLFIEQPSHAFSDTLSNSIGQFILIVLMTSALFTGAAVYLARKLFFLPCQQIETLLSTVDSSGTPESIPNTDSPFFTKIINLINDIISNVSFQALQLKEKHHSVSQQLETLSSQYQTLENKQAQYESERELMTNALNYCQQVAGKRLDQIDFADLFELLASRFQLEKITGYLFSEDKEMMSLFHDRYPQGGAVASESPKQLPTARFSWSHQILMSGEKVVVDDVNDMPVNAFAEQNLWRGIHIKSQLVLPLTSGQHTFGFISCSMLSHPIEWKAALINELNYVCQLIAPFIQNAAKQTMLRKTKNQLAVATQRLNQIARQDSLTGMANKARFDEVIDLEYRRLQRHQKTLTLYLIGVDFFDEYNEHYGHTAGAACLKTVGTIIQNSFQRAADLSAKIGDAQFAVVLPGVTENDALILANNLRDKILVANILHRASKITDRVTISVGIATCIPTTQAPPSHLVERATAALESAKEAGGDQADLAPPELEIEGQEEPLE